MHIFYEWLISIKINNIYESKEAFVYAYLTNSETGLNSLSLSTLKLLTINPILDFDILRKLYADRKFFHAEESAKIALLHPEEQQQARIANFANMLVMVNDNMGKSSADDD